MVMVEKHLMTIALPICVERKGKGEGGKDGGREIESGLGPTQ